MKRILLSLFVIAAVSGAAILGTNAYFSDTEKSTENKITAGTIDISVDGKNPWSENYSKDLTDLKPGVTRYIEFTVKNVGENPVVLRKQLGHFITDGGSTSEPECEAENGQWVQGNESGTCVSPSNVNDDLSKVIIYDMTVTPEEGQPIEIIPESWGKTLADVQDLWVPLGTIEPGKTLVVKQSYTLDPNAGNEYQGDALTFDITLYGEQRLGIGLNTLDGVVLDNKTGDQDWYSVVDGILGFFHYDSSDDSFTFIGYGLENHVYNLSYRLASGDTPISFASGTPSGGVLTLSGIHDFGGASNVFIDLIYGSGWGDPLKNLWQDNQTNFTP